MKLDILQADYSNKKHQEAIIELLNNYAKDPMGGGKALESNVKEKLIATLASYPTAFSVLAFVNNQAAGLINCFESLSTFKCKPLVNIHDISVNSEFRGLGLSQKMLQQVTLIAKERGCCKLTLEVLEGNLIAKKAYEKFGFSGYQLNPEHGKALFWEKSL